MKISPPYKLQPYLLWSRFVSTQRSLHHLCMLAGASVQEGELSVISKGQPARALVPHPTAVSLHPRVGCHLRLHLLFLLLSVHLT